MGTAEKKSKKDYMHWERICADMEKLHILAVPIRTNGAERDKKNGEMEKCCFRKTCGPGGGAWYNRQKYPAAYPGIWEYGLAQFDIDGTCAGSG